MKSKHDWPKLKKEFMQGDWLTVIDFLKDKNLLMSLRGSPHIKGWAEEKREMKKDALDLATKELVQKDADDINVIRQRQARLSRYLQLKGLAAIKKKKPETVDEARRLVIGGMEQERKALGIESGKGAQKLTQINIGSQTNLDKLLKGLDYEGVLKLIAELKRERARRGGEETSSDSKPKAQEGEVI